nr:GATA zinc finger domain containing 2A [Protopterus annectens]
MTEEACRTRSQKRALERDTTHINDVDSKKIKLEKGFLGVDLKTDGELRIKAETGAAKVHGLLKSAEVKATIKVEVPTGDEPVDMSTTKSDIMREKRPPSPDVIVLSDNEPSSPRMNGLTKLSSRETNTEMLMKSTPEERDRIIKQLKEELRLEEAKLVLLKKLRQSQIQKETPLTATPIQKPPPPPTAVAAPPPLVRGTQTIPSIRPPLQVTPVRTSSTVIPPPLVRGGQQLVSKLGPQNTQIVMPPLVRGPQPLSVSPQQVHNIRQHSSAGPPPLLLAPRAAVPNVQVQGQRIIQQGLIRVANVPNVPNSSLLVNIPQFSKGSSLELARCNTSSPVSVGRSICEAPSSTIKSTTVTAAQPNITTTVTQAMNANDTPASRQAAAKLALRKQLEKTLLEIPPPKPPAPELNFLPSAANNEFIYLVGLEEVVQNLLESQGKAVAVPPPKEPCVCAQCNTDFTCRWRQEKNGKIMCENCMTSNQKKVLKAEHTNRLKAAFVKALQQEQEIEQRIMQQTSSPAQTKPEPVVQHHTLKQQSSVQLPRGPLPSNRGVLHTFSPPPKLQNAAALVTRPGKHFERPLNKGNIITPTTWKKQTPIGSGGPLAFVNPGLSVHKSSAVDRQREYLLDMIPPRSITQSATTWK